MDDGPVNPQPVAVPLAAPVYHVEFLPPEDVIGPATPAQVGDATSYLFEVLRKRGRNEAGFTSEGVCQALDYQQAVMAKRPNAMDGAPPWAVQMQANITTYMANITTDIATLNNNINQLRRDVVRALSFERANNSLGMTVMLPGGRPPALDPNIPYPIPVPSSSL